MNRKAKIVTIGALIIMGLITALFVVASGKPQCRDGIDNDGDTRIDYPNDPGCINRNDNSELNLNVQCDDNLDNDGDTKVDYPDDPGCSSPSDSSELSTAQCDNGVDDSDADTLKDWPNDAGCVSLTDTSEVNGQCDDTFDNDVDGLTDFPADPECASFSDIEGDCSDTDGFNTAVQGTTFGSFGGVPFNSTDFCANSLTLTEYFCNGYNLGSQNVGCNATNSCINGACA